MDDPVVSNAILVLNAGSSSIKLAVFVGQLQERLSGIADAIGGASRLRIGSKSRDLPLIDHRGRRRSTPVRLMPEPPAEITSCKLPDGLTVGTQPFAGEHLCNRTLRYAGSLIAALERLNAIAFSSRSGRVTAWGAPALLEAA